MLPGMEINLRCPGCGNGVFLEEGRGRCSKCGRETVAEHLPAPGQPLSACACCERRDLYRQRDFNRNLGVGIATAGCLAAFALFFFDWLAGLGTLAGVGLLDLLLYLSLDEVVVCYACGAIHRGFAKDPAVKPFSLMMADRYEKRTGGPVHA